MVKNSQFQIEVHAHWMGLPKPTLMGHLHVVPSRGKEIFSFEYANDWLNSNQIYILDPALQLYKGKQYAPNEQNNFGVFLDSSPDRWGRFLMKRREHN